MGSSGYSGTTLVTKATHIGTQIPSQQGRFRAKLRYYIRRANEAPKTFLLAKAMHEAKKFVLQPYYALGARRVWERASGAKVSEHFLGLSRDLAAAAHARTAESATYRSRQAERRSAVEHRQFPCLGYGT